MRSVICNRNFTLGWPEELIQISRWALQNEDSRHRYIYSKSASELHVTAGISNCLETSAVLSIFEACLGKGYILGKTIDREKKLPDFEGEQCTKRADLAFRKSGKGQNWAYVEVKKYGNRGGKIAIEKDISKLKSIEKKCQRWMLIYRIKTNSEAHTLEYLLNKNFVHAFDFDSLSIVEFQTITKKGFDSVCEIAVCRIK
jgi:hypothetical protein